MRAFVPRPLPADDRPAATKIAAAWSHAFQRTAERGGAFASAADGRIVLDDLHVSGEDGPDLGCHAALVAIARVPARAERVTVTCDVAIEALELRLVVRAGLASARLRLELVVREAGTDGDELGRTEVELADLTAAGPDVAERPLAAGAVRVPLACGWRPSATPPREVHVELRAWWDVDCGVDGQFVMRGRAIARPPVIAAIGAATPIGRLAPPRRRSLPF